jgi:hypothetical protein
VKLKHLFILFRPPTWTTFVLVRTVLVLDAKGIPQKRMAEIATG